MRKLISILFLMALTFNVFAANVHVIKSDEYKVYEVQPTIDDVKKFANYIKSNNVERLSKRRFLQKNVYGYDKIYVVLNNAEVELLEYLISER